MKRVIVASKNPVKINAAQIGFESMFETERFVFEGANVGSDVSNQPMGDDETFRGAYNRATKAREEFSNADYWIGIEGGNISHNQNEMEAMAWIVVLDKSRMGKARTAGFFLPQKVIDLVNQGYELGHADEIVFGINNTKQKMGTTGLLTDNVIDRTQYYVQAVILALIPFLKKDLY
ncbi:MAG TPA: inosine/xanthosine triphosphatase [Leadbetterella sp.]|jgi:inosine/xanthosine triphosphatase|nr:inosine/xanthosine triphosphatase [Leadbetterella sp.]